MKKLLRNKGNILFASIVFFVVILIGFSLCNLVITYSYQSKKQTASLYDYYTYESCSRAMVTEIIHTICDLEVTTFYNPLMTSAEHQIKLQSAIWDALLDPMGTWNYSDPLPPELRYMDNSFSISLNIQDMLVDYSTDMKATTTLGYKDLPIEVTWSDYTFRGSISGLQISYWFDGGVIHCCFKDEAAHLAGGTLIQA